MKKLTLLEKAKELPELKRSKKVISAEEIELALAWLDGEISMINCARAMGYNHSSYIMYRMNVILREAYVRGFLVKEIGNKK